MNTLKLDPAVCTQLDSFSGPVELCDESGRTIGHFLPIPLYREILVAWSRAEVSDEEIERQMQEPGGCSLQEIWQRLGNV